MKKLIIMLCACAGTSLYAAESRMSCEEYSKLAEDFGHQAKMHDIEHKKALCAGQATKDTLLADANHKARELGPERSAEMQLNADIALIEAQALACQHNAEAAKAKAHQMHHQRLHQLCLSSPKPFPQQRKAEEVHSHSTGMKPEDVSTPHGK